MSKRKFTLLIVLLAINFRIAITAISPLFGKLQVHYGVSSTTLSLLATIPLFCFSIGSFLCYWLIEHVGINNTLLSSLLVLTLANFFRTGNWQVMIIGTILVGLSVSILNVAAPVLIATYFPNMSAKFTSYYSVTMNLFSALGTSLVIPLSNLSTWKVAIRFFSAFSLIALISYALIGGQDKLAKSPNEDLESKTNNVWKQKKTWIFSLFLGFQSLVFYSLVAWLPQIFISLNQPSDYAGTLLSVFQLVGIPAALVLARFTNLRRLIYIILVCYLSGFIMLILALKPYWLASALLGFSGAMLFTLALVMITNSNDDPEQVSALSGMSQFIGYLIAAIGPSLIGFLHDQMMGWKAILIIITIIMVLAILLGLWSLKLWSLKDETRQ